MRRTVGSIPAVLLLTALALPWVMGVAALAHNADGHHDHALANQDPMGILELAVHGHHHEPGTPSHQHAFTLAKPAPPGTKISLAQGVMASVTPGQLLPNATRISASFCVDFAHGPPSTSRTVQILRI